MNLEMRDIIYSKRIIESLNLDLSGLTVLTECASGSYMFTPILALLAGAKEVIAVGKDTSHGTFLENKHRIEETLSSNNIGANISFFKDHAPKSEIVKADIITNSGQLRPITAEVIDCFKPTAVLALMWETWEFRYEDLDIRACQDKGIPVIGTDESYEKIKLFDYDGILALKLLLDLGIEVHNNVILLIGGGIVGRHIERTLNQLDIKNYWLTETGQERQDNCISFENRSEILDLDYLDAVIFSELEFKEELVGLSNGKLSFCQLKNSFPALRVGHISGKIDLEELKNSQLTYLPDSIKPIGYISYGLEQIGSRPVIELMAAGLKVGELVAKSRIKGDSIGKAISVAVEHGVGQDFDEGFTNYGRNREA